MLPRTRLQCKPWVCLWMQKHSSSTCTVSFAIAHSAVSLAAFISIIVINTILIISTGIKFIMTAIIIVIVININMDINIINISITQTLFRTEPQLGMYRLNQLPACKPIRMAACSDVSLMA